MPGRELVLSVISMLILFTILGAMELLLTPIPISGIVFALLYSALRVFAMDPIKVYVFKLLYNIEL